MAEQDIYAWSGSLWVPVKGDAAGHLQVDVITAGGTASHCYGFDGANWQTLLVESAALKNLRVRLYAGAVPVAVERLSSFSLPDATFTLATSGGIYLSESGTATWYEWRNALSVNDGDAGRYFPSVGIYGYNGATWDRLRAYGTGILKVGRAEVGLLTARMTAVGQVGAAGARKLYWMNITPSAGNSVVELTDATAGGGAVVYDCFHTAKESHVHQFDPPMEFSNGIYLETFTNMTSIVFGYL